MLFYKCYVAVDGWGAVYTEDVSYIWATDEVDAKMQYCKQNGFRKNKKGLTIEQVEYKKSRRKKVTRNEVITEKVYEYWLGSYEQATYKDVDHYYCSNCGKEVHTDRYCTRCNSELTN